MRISICGFWDAKAGRVFSRKELERGELLVVDGDGMGWGGCRVNGERASGELGWEDELHAS